MQKLLIIISLIISDIVTFGQNDLLNANLFSNSGYININELIYGYGLGSTVMPYSKQYYGFTTMHGYQLNFNRLRKKNNLVGGIGTGMLFYNGGHLFPLYFELRYIRNRERISPFVTGNSGLLINTTDFKGGSKFFVSGGGGIRFKINNQLAANFGTGIFLQKGKDGLRDSFINLKIGLIYKPK